MAVKPAPKPAPRPAPKPASRPEPRAAERPTERPTERPSVDSGPTSTEATKPTERPARTPERKPTERPDEKPVASAADVTHAGKRPPVRPNHAPRPKPTADSGTGGQPSDAMQDLAGTNFQQEVDILRSQLTTLNIAGVWTDANPPQFTGIYGKLLQGLGAGVALRNMGIRLNAAAARTRDNSATILRLVQNHKTPTFTIPKGK